MGELDRGVGRGRRGRLRLADAATLLAVATVVLLVSLPRLRDFALRENQGDARGLVARLGRLLDDEVHAAEVGNVQDAIAGDPALARQLEDVEYLEHGRLLRRHGYLFEVLPGAAPQRVTVRAWPWEHGRTGLASFVWIAHRGLAGHPNTDGRWTGTGGGPAPVFAGSASPDGDGWRLVED